MKSKKNYKLLIFIVMIFLGIIISINLDFIREFLEKNIFIYGYIAIFFFSFLTDLIMQPLGPEVPGSIALVLNLNPSYIIMLILIGSYLGSFISYFIGKYFLKSNTNIFYKKETEKKYLKIFRKYGKFSLLIASISPIPYVPFCWIAGAAKMKISNFIIFGLIPRTVRILIILFFIDIIF